MADPIRLTNSTPKDLSTKKVTRTARQKFENRQKRQQKEPGTKHPSNDRRAKPLINYENSGMHTRNSREKKVPQSASQGRAAGNPDHGHGKVIDVRI